MCPYRIDERPVQTFSGLVCPVCRQPVALIENRTARSLVFQCQECGNRWSAAEQAARVH